MKPYQWFISGSIGVMTGVGTEVLTGVWGVLAGMIGFLVVAAGFELAEWWERRNYRLTREQAFRLHRQMLDYATTDSWQTSMNRGRK